jgi:hypothetical protein
MTQLEESRLLRARLLKQFAELVELVEVRDSLMRLLEKVQNAPPAGEADGTITEVQYRQLQSIHKAIASLLIAQLFNSV